MKRSSIIIVAVFFFATSYSQSPVDFGKFPIIQSDTTTLLTADLLEKINWPLIKSFCAAAEGHYAYEKRIACLQVIPIQNKAMKLHLK